MEHLLTYVSGEGPPRREFRPSSHPASSTPPCSRWDPADQGPSCAYTPPQHAHSRLPTHTSLRLCDEAPYSQLLSRGAQTENRRRSCQSRHGLSTEPSPGVHGSDHGRGFRCGRTGEVPCRVSHAGSDCTPTWCGEPGGDSRPPRDTDRGPTTCTWEAPGKAGTLGSGHLAP
jgi:hypothetical protein